MTREHEQLTVPSIRIVGEQDGPAEQKIKTQFSEFLAGTGFQCRAYLVRAKYGSSDELNVALLVRLQSGDSRFVNSGLGRLFHSVFRPDQHLDIMFLSESEEENVKTLVKPFFSSSEAN